MQRFFAFLLLFSFAGYLGREAWRFWPIRDALPQGTTIAQLDMSGQSRQDAQALLIETYNAPLLVLYGEEVIELSPADAHFEMDVARMVDEAFAQLDDIPHWQRYASFVLGRSLVTPIDVPLQASHDPVAVRQLLTLVANLLDQPATAPQLLTDTGFIQQGTAGYVMDITTSVALFETALYAPQERVIELIIADQPAPQLNLAFLEQHLRQQLEGFDGVGSLYILDLATGEELGLNADAAVSGLSIVKIAIMLETYRVVDGPLNADQQNLLNQTAIFSGNYSANLLLDVVAGQNNAYLGVDILTQSMRRLGLTNTFIATPYEEPPRAGKATYITPANSQRTVDFDPDPAMQTTAAEMGQLLAMIYDCAQGGGALIAAYPEQLTPAECQALLNTMTLNTEGNLIRFGVPEEVPVAHKHGWAYNTHGDAGIVFSPGGDYVIVQYLHQDSDWLNAGVSFPLLRELSRSVYNYYNINDPYVDHKRAQKTAGKFAVEQIAQEIENGRLPLTLSEPAP